jgi:hypothetical protein
MRTPTRSPITSRFSAHFISLYFISPNIYYFTEGRPYSPLRHQRARKPFPRQSRHSARHFDQDIYEISDNENDLTHWENPPTFSWTDEKTLVSDLIDAPCVFVSRVSSV